MDILFNMLSFQMREKMSLMAGEGCVTSYFLYSRLYLSIIIYFTEQRPQKVHSMDSTF